MWNQNHMGLFSPFLANLRFGKYVLIAIPVPLQSHQLLLGGRKVLASGSD
jgi:hypothetical protein